MEQQLINLVIDGQPVRVPPGTTVLEAAQKAGIAIPTFCHHPKLTPIGACRMCLVEVEKMRGLQTACTTQVREGMVVHVNSPAAREAREWVLRFLLTHHPLDCPVCDKGGECTLQDQTVAHGPTESWFIEPKRHKKKATPISPFIILDQERCVLCRRCARFGEEYTDHRQLGLFERGRRTEIDVFPGHPFTSKFSGNAVDLCPVGALTSRVFRFQARSWELAEVPGVCNYCGVGCNIAWGVKNNRVRRIVPREHASINDQWLCDKGRFAHAFLEDPRRLRTPLVRRDGELREATWEEALGEVARRLAGVMRDAGPDAVAGIGSTRTTNEASYLFQRFLRAVVGTNNVAHLGRLPEGAELPGNPASLTEADLIVLAGVDPSEELPLMELWIKRAVLRRGAKVLVLHPQRVELADYKGAWLAYRPGAESALANGLAKAVLATQKARKVSHADEVEEGLRAESLAKLAERAGLKEAQCKEAAHLLTGAAKAVVLTGEGWVANPFGAQALQALVNLARLAGAEGPFYLAPDNNTVGAMDTGLLPERLPGGQRLDDVRVRDRLGKWWGTRKLSTSPGLAAKDLWPALEEGRVKAVYVFGSDPASESAAAARALAKAEFLVVQDLFLTATAARADVVLPAAGPAAEEGTYTNLEGRVQHLGAGLRPLGASRPDWQIVQDLARALIAELGEESGRNVAAWQFDSPGAVFAEMAKALPAYNGLSYEALGAYGVVRPPAGPALTVGRAALSVLEPSEEYPFILWVGRVLYDRGTLASCSRPLLELVPEATLTMHPKDAAQVGVPKGAQVRVRSEVGEVVLPVRTDADVPPGVVIATRNLGEEPLGALLLPDQRVALVRLEAEP
ncbi:MAG: NADH-quinone oxidoreductase subunit NuoG [Anaerolineae bacterium]